MNLMDQDFKQMVIRDLDLIREDLKEQNKKIDLLLTHMTVSKTRHGLISAFLGAVGGFIAVLLK